MKRKLCCVLAAMSLLFAGCGAPGDVSEFTPATGAGERQTLVVYTSHWEEVYSPIIKEFQERTGIWVFVEYGGTLDLMQRLEDESAAPQCDVMFGGGAESHEAYKRLFEAYETPLRTELDATYLSADNSWTPFAVLPVVIVYNTKLVSNPPTSWADLLGDEWEGRIAFADPGTSASCFTALATLMQAVEGDSWEVHQRFAESFGGELLSGSSAITSAVAAGQYPIGICLEEAAQRKIYAGSNLGIVYPEEGTSLVPDATSLVQGAPNPEAAKAFIDFTVSREVQMLLVEQTGRRPVRTDVDSPAGLRPLDDIVVYPYDYAWVIENRERILYMWQREF